MKQPTIVLPEHVLCEGCKKPIHLDDFGCMASGGGKKGHRFYHNNACCMLDFIKSGEKAKEGRFVSENKRE